MNRALLLFLSAPVLQEPSAPPVADPPPALEGELLLTGGVEAPDQPRGESSASVTRTPRFAPGASRAPHTSTLTPIGSLVDVRGQEANHVMGIGIVTGLAGSGDSGNAAKQLLQNLLLTRDINLDLSALSSKNVAVVRVEADVPAGIEPGRRIDVRVSTIGDATSLQGGTLAMTELTDVTGQHVYATAAGPVTVGGFQVDGASASATRNHVTVGTLPGGGKIEREVPTRLVSEHGYLYLDLRPEHDTVGNVVKIAQAINELYPDAARAAGDGKTIKVEVPVDLPEAAHVVYLQTVLEREIASDNVARVILNERTGVIVMGGDVRLRPGAIAHGNLTVTIAETPEASQPGPLSQGTSEVLDRTRLDVEVEDNALVLVPGAVTLQEVVDVLNVLGTTPRDLISILQAMSQGGLLVAEIRRM